MKKPVQRGGNPAGIGKRKKHMPHGYWKNPEHREQMRNAIRTHLSRNPHATAEELARHFGYADFHTVGQIMRQGKGDHFRLGDLGKVQKTGKHGGFRRKRPYQERHALYKRVMQEIIRNPFLEYRELAQKMGITYVAFKGVVELMQNRRTMPPQFLEAQRLKAVRRLKEQGLAQNEIASRLGTDKSTVSRYASLLEKIKEFAEKRKKPVEWVINRYGTLIEKGIMEKTNMNLGVRILRKTRGGVG